MYKRLSAFVVTFIFFFLLLTNSAFAQTLPTIGANLNDYVPPDESECDINVSPSQEHPIQNAIDAANPGDTICVGPGDYYENLSTYKSIRLSGSGLTSKIHGIIQYSTISIRASNVTVEGFVIIGIGTTRYHSAIVLSASDIPSISGDIIRYNYIISGTGAQALRTEGNLTGNPTSSVIENNVFEGHNSLDAIVHISDSGENKVFINNTIIGTVSAWEYNHWGSALWLTSPYSIINRNVFRATGYNGQVYSAHTITVHENNFINDARYKLHNYPIEGILNAENNWWGVTNPDYYATGSVVGPNIDFIPFMTTPFPEYPVPQIPTNQLPVAKVGVDQTVLVNELVTLDGSQSYDPDSDTITYSWSEDASNPQSGILSDPSSVNPTFTPTVAGVYQFTLVVNDGQANSNPDTVTVTVQTPAEAIDDLIVEVGDINAVQGIVNSLDAKLDAALNALSDLNENNDQAAINSLNSFINSVEAQRGNQITDEQADILIAAVQAIIDSLLI